MSLLWIDGFEKYGTTTVSPVTILNWKYLQNNQSPIPLATGRYGGKALQLTAVGIKLTTPDLNPTSDTLIVGFAFKSRDVADGQIICDIKKPTFIGSVITFSSLRFKLVNVASANEIRVERGSTTLATSSGLDITPDTWYYFEAKVKCHDTSGTCNICVNEVEVVSFSGDTNFGSHTDRYSRVTWDIDFADEFSIDDLYICDSGGSTNNDFLGECRVETLSPTSDASGNWAPNTGSDLYAAVDEDIQDANYIKDTTTGNQAVFEMTNLSTDDPSASGVAGVMLCCDSQQTSRFRKHPKLITQNGAGTIQDSGAFMPGTDNPLCYTQIMENDPDGNPWSSSTVNTFRMGVEVS